MSFIAAQKVFRPESYDLKEGCKGLVRVCPPHKLTPTGWKLQKGKPRSPNLRQYIE